MWVAPISTSGARLESKGKEEKALHGAVCSWLPCSNCPHTVASETMATNCSLLLLSCFLRPLSQCLKSDWHLLHCLLFNTLRVGFCHRAKFRAFSLPPPPNLYSLAETHFPLSCLVLATTSLCLKLRIYIFWTVDVNRWWHSIACFRTSFLFIPWSYSCMLAFSCVHPAISEWAVYCEQRRLSSHSPHWPGHFFFFFCGPELALKTKWTTILFDDWNVQMAAQCSVVRMTDV